jgi:hypothetical protein
MQTIPSPSHTTLMLDTRHVMYATDKDGKIIPHEETGKPVQIAQDLITGDWYAKLADSIPFSSRDKSLAKNMVDGGGVHVTHENGDYRGVWFPCGAAEKPVAASKPKGNA